ncbi:hypothetical protein V1264_017908 [Littorina saxatilis]|uniref:Uncharacterized protein n=1 Tax=Littorina saxatilis TaxID=31220 RepID=A0AAN9BJF7_9CAEN
MPPFFCVVICILTLQGFSTNLPELHPEEDQGTVKGGQLVGLTLVAVLLLAAITYVCVFVFRHQKQPE